MKKSTRALVGRIVMEAVIAAGAWWMVAQVQSGAWQAIVPAEAISRTMTVAGGVMGIIAGVLIVAFFVHRQRGD